MHTNKNTLIDLLPKEIQGVILSKANLVDFDLSQKICIVHQKTQYLYFPIDGFISIVQNIDQYPPLEVGMIGHEGVLGAEIILGIQTNCFSAIVQGSGSAWQIRVDDFLDHISNIPKLKQIINSYIAIRISQLGLSASCEHFHEIGPRLAKWLLMSKDRAKSSSFLMTHEFISLMLGIRRVGVTTAAADFRRRGLIDYHRGEMTILNHDGLKSEACSCYEKNREIYTSLIHQFNVVKIS